MLDDVDPLTGRLLVVSRRDLLERGFTPRSITEAVRRGSLIRLRRDHYARPDVEPFIEQAVRVGGLLDCVSAAARLGIWIPENMFPHISLKHGASRMRSPRNRQIPLSPMTSDGVTLHWWPLIAPDSATAHCVGILDALAHIVRCQPRELAIAALDSALHRGAVTDDQLDDLFTALPRKYRTLRRLLDRRAESGLESIVRILLQDAGYRVDVQTFVSGVGRVDLVVEGLIVVETDGDEWHRTPEAKARDYQRDAELVRQGYIVLRFNYAQVMFAGALVLEVVRAALRTHSGYLG